MANASNFLADGVLNTFFKVNAAAPTRPTNCYMALFTDNGPAADGTGGTEVSGSSYARLLIVNSAGSTNKLGAIASVNGVETVTNNADLIFAACTTTLYVVQSVALVNTASGAFTLLASPYVLSNPVTVAVGTSFRVLNGNLTLACN